MFIRQYFKDENGGRTAYWALVESYRTATGPRQRIVAWLGKLDEAGRLGVKHAAADARRATSTNVNHDVPLNTQRQFEFDDDITATEPRWVEVNAAGVRVENLRQFGGPWLALHLIQTLQLDTFLKKAIPEGREHVPWDVTSLILIIARLSRLAIFFRGLLSCVQMVGTRSWQKRACLAEGYRCRHLSLREKYSKLYKQLLKNSLHPNLTKRANETRES